MFVERYTSRVSDKFDSPKARYISELNRDSYMTPQYLRMLSEEIAAVKTTGRVALLYAGGPANHHSDARNINNLSIPGKIVVKGQIGYTMFKVAKQFPDVEYVNINANTCASSMHSIYEAKKLIQEGFDDVIVYAEDMVEATQLFLFEQLGVDLVCGDGVAFVHFTKERTPDSIAEVYDATWLWNKDSSPMTNSEEGYSRVLRQLDLTSVKVIKPHSTGTKRNDIGESAAMETALPGVPIVKFKHKIGHTQGASSIIELCLLLDRSFEDAVLLASGMGGFYGGCCVRMLR